MSEEMKRAPWVDRLLDAYRARIRQKRQPCDRPYGEREREFPGPGRRGRYVELQNWFYDPRPRCSAWQVRGRSPVVLDVVAGRVVDLRYDWRLKLNPGSEEARLAPFLQAREHWACPSAPRRLLMTAGTDAEGPIGLLGGSLTSIHHRTRSAWRARCDAQKLGLAQGSVCAGRCGVAKGCGHRCGRTGARMIGGWRDRRIEAHRFRAGPTAKLVAARDPSFTVETLRKLRQQWAQPTGRLVC